MTLDKAIEIHKALCKIHDSKANTEPIAALKLGIEALKNYQKLKLTTFLPIGYRLPGETNDD